jgi:hypothetical protein
MSTTSKPFRQKKSGNKRDGDWTCVCGASCFASRNDCFKCKASKPSTPSKSSTVDTDIPKRQERKKTDGSDRPSRVERITKLNMKNMMSESPPQQENEFLSFITDRFKEKDSLIKLSTRDQICDWLKFSTEEKLYAESFINCKKNQIDTVSDYLDARHNLLDKTTVIDILNTLVVIKDDFILSKVEKDVIRAYYLYNLIDMVKIKQGGAKYSLGIKMKTLCIHVVIKDICKLNNINTNMAE